MPNLKLLWEVAFEQENRLRALEGKPPVDRVEYFATVNARLREMLRQAA